MSFVHIKQMLYALPRKLHMKIAEDFNSSLVALQGD